MTSQQEERLSAHLDGALSLEEEAALSAELAASPQLRARLAELAAVDEAVRAMGGPVAGEDLKQRLRARLTEGDGPAVPRSPAGRGPARRRFGRLAASAALAASALLVVWLAVGPESPESDGSELVQIPLTETIPEDFLVASDEADREVIEVLDLLAVLDELEEGSS